MLERFGARKWIARIMLSWGILSGAMAFIPVIGRTTGLGNEYSFYLVRVLLGMAEAGFFPGIIFYLTLWFPTEYRARIVGYFMAAIPLSTVIGAPISGVLLYRQPCRIRRSVCDGVDQGPYRQLCRRFAAGGARHRGDGHRAGARA
jgi:MFS family permease